LTAGGRHGLSGPISLAQYPERVSKPDFAIRGQTPRLPRSLRSLAMTVQCVGEALAASRTGARKGLPLRATQIDEQRHCEKRSDEAIPIWLDWGFSNRL